jgi:hypothetical protein
MKKLLIPLLTPSLIILFIVCVSCKKEIVMSNKMSVGRFALASLDTSYSSTIKKISSNLDTLLITATTVVTTKVTYDTVVHKYVAPLVVALDSNSFALQPLYKSSLPVTYSGKSNFTISGLTLKGGTYGIYLNGCSNVVISFNRIVGASKYEIYLYNCKNVKVLYNYISGGVSGVHAENSSSIVVNHNQIGDILGPFPGGNFVQFVNVSGPKTSISYNRCEDIAGVGKPEDGLSLYKSNGAQGDSIMVIGNWIRGGQYYNTSGGAAGIVLGDLGGSYQVARYNILVNSGFVGAQVQGGSHIKMDHNIIFSTATPYSNDGMSFGNYSGLPVSDITMSYNKIKFFNKSGVESDDWYDPKAGLIPAGWYTNILKANIDATVLPVVIRTWK